MAKQGNRRIQIVTARGLPQATAVWHTSEMSDAQKNPPATPQDEALSEHHTPTENNGKRKRPVELGGRDGPDPTRYGDWEKAGRCIDF